MANRNYSSSSRTQNRRYEKVDIAWITGEKKIDNEAVKWAEEAGKYLVDKGLTTSSLRRFFGEVRRIQSDFEKHQEDIPLLRAKLAYDSNRSGKNGVEDFYELLKDSIIAIEGDAQRFARFVKIAEAVVAFHKAAGGRD